MKTITFVLATSAVITLTITSTPALLAKKEQAEAFTNTSSADRMLLVLSAPSIHEKYYAEVFDQIIEFDIAYAKAVMGHDNIIILADKDTLPYLQDELPDDILLEANVADIWMRDFTTVLPSRMVQFSYTPSYLSRSASRYIQSSFDRFATQHRLEFQKSALILDGGNVVDNNDDKIIVTERILEDNRDWTTEEIIAELKYLLHVEHVAIIPQEEGEPMGHADGIVMFVSEDTVAVNTYGEPFRNDVISVLESDLPGITIVEIEADYSLEIWKDFVSACGINLNSTVTNNYIYMPVFGNPNDEKSIVGIEALTDKKIIPINAKGVCFMGGSVRCLSWQVTGENAQALIEAARK